MIQFFSGPVFHKLVVDAQSDDARRVAVIGHPLQYCASQTSGNHAVFCRHNGLVFLSHFVQDLFVQRLEPPHIVVSIGNPSRPPLKGGDRFAHGVADSADSQYGNVFSVSQLNALAVPYCLPLGEGWGEDCSSSRIANSDGAVQRLCHFHHLLQVFGCTRRTNLHVRYRT